MSNPYAPPDPNRPPTPPRQVPTPDERRRELERRDPQPDPPSPEQLRATTRQMLLFGALMLATLLATQTAQQYPRPWVAPALVVGISTLAIGVRLLRRVLRMHWRGFLPVMLIAGLFLSGLATVSAAVPLVLWDAYTQAQECRERAITVSAQNQCEADFRAAIAERRGASQP